jgi:hypothetical protein
MKGCVGDALPSVDARVSLGGKVRILGREWDNSQGLEALTRIGNRWFVGGPGGLFEFYTKTGDMLDMRSVGDLPLGQVTMVESGRHGTYIYSVPYVYKVQADQWHPVNGFHPRTDPVDAGKNGSFPLHSFGPDELYFGTWGYGFFSFKGGVQRQFHAGEGSSCIESALEGVNYPVVQAQAPYRQDGLFLGMFRDKRNYQLAYYDAGRREVTCFNVDSKDTEPRNLEVAGNVLVVTTGRGLEAFRIREAGGRVSLDPQDLILPQVNFPEPTRVSRMDDFGNLWVTTEGGRIQYIPSIDFDSAAVSDIRTLPGFPGTDCKSLARDGRGHLWAGCTQGGVIEIIPSRDSLLHSFRRYRLDDGLLSETVDHLDVNPDNGDVWVVSEKGVSRFQSPSRPLARSLSSAKVYPNPFRARHAHVLFDNLSQGSRIEVLAQGGSVVYQATLKPDDGGQLRWDGRNASGQKVKEGVYFYVIRSSKDTRHGRLVVAR